MLFITLAFPEPSLSQAPHAHSRNLAPFMGWKTRPSHITQQTMNVILLLVKFLLGVSVAPGTEL